MSKVASGEIKTRIVHQTQKNGDSYVLERKTIYDPVKKYNKIISSKLLSKIPKGQHISVPTRPKRAKAETVLHSVDVKATTTNTEALRSRVGMMSIIDQLGKDSGIDAAIYSNTDLGTAQKLVSLARYLLATNGQSFPGITAWQYTHPLPYEDGISEDIYHELFRTVGLDESLQQNFFASRCAEIKDKAILAYDSTTVSTYSGNLTEARYGLNKAGDGLPTIKLLTLYSIETGQPIAFTKQPGNLPDIITIRNALKQLSALGIQKAEIITDNGYYSEKNLADMLQTHFDFITLSKTSINWVKDELRKRAEDFRNISTTCPFDTNTHGITIKLMHDFTRARKYASRKEKLDKGTEEVFTRRIYLHLYFNPMRRVEQCAALDKDLFELKDLLESGTAIDELTEKAQKKVEKYLEIRHYQAKTTVVFKEKAIREAKETHGYFALVSNCERDAFACLRKYRRREAIESFFEAGKQHADGTRTRVWNTDSLRGRLFVQFVALCYYEYLRKKLQTIQGHLAKETGDPAHDTKGILKMEAKLKSWLNTTPLYLVLQWFDTVEEVKVSTKLWVKRWSTEITQRDQLFLSKLGVQWK